MEFSVVGALNAHPFGAVTPEDVACQTPIGVLPRPTPVRFDGRVVVITGAARGLGRAYALAIADRGGAVVVNDVGGSVAGEGGSASPAEQVVATIRTRGGRAVANADDVGTAEGAAGVIAAARGAFGRVDAVIANAGILRDRTLLKMPPQDFEAVIRVHLLGAAWVVQAALPLMKEQGYGRVVVTTSHSGLFGNFGQTNYAAAKLGLVGFMLALKEEGTRHGILANAIAPLAVTRLGAGVFPPELEARLTPEQVAPVVTWLASEQCHISGEVLLAGAGRIARAVLLHGAGITSEAPLAPEDIGERWPEIASMSDARPFGNISDALRWWLGGPGFGPGVSGSSPTA
jgi:NAD(P)-dependent dehydrogenase (short-subunit alcohol dehydrogenase family)